MTHEIPQVLVDKVTARITEARWQTLASELIKAGQPLSGNALDPDIEGAQEEAIAILKREMEEN